MAAAVTWGHQWQGKWVKFMCDNQAIVHAWQGQSPCLMNLIRNLLMFAAQHHFTITMQHFPGKTNSLADGISHKQFTKFFSLAPQAQ